MDECVARDPPGHAVWPAHDAGHLGAALSVERTLTIRPVVGDEQDNSVVGDAQLVEFIEQQSEAVVHPKVARLVLGQSGGGNALHDAVAIHQPNRFLEDSLVGNQRLAK